MVHLFWSPTCRRRSVLRSPASRGDQLGYADEIDLLPRKVIPEVHIIRVAFLNLGRVLEKMPEGYKFRTFNRCSDQYIKPYWSFVDMLKGACHRSVVELNAAIQLR
jgi:hypothetical protein